MKLVLIGGGGHAGAVADVARSAGLSVLGVLGPTGSPVPPGLLRLGDDDWAEQAPADTGLHIAFGPRVGSSARHELFETLQRRGVRLPAIIASTAIVSPSASVGPGSIAMHATVINTSADVGRNCILNTRAVVEHDCRIGAHTHVAPGAVIGGGVDIGERCLIGAGAVLLPGIAIADGTIIGAGAVVIRSITQPDETWSGNPARRHQ